MILYLHQKHASSSNFHIENNFRVHHWLRIKQKKNYRDLLICDKNLHNTFTKILLNNVYTSFSAAD